MHCNEQNPEVIITTIIIYLGSYIHFSGPLSRDPVPKILFEHQIELILKMNAVIQETAGTKICWSKIKTKLASFFSIGSKLHNWLSKKTSKSSHIKTLYLSQLTWNNEWNEVIDTKGRIQGKIDTLFV